MDNSHVIELTQESVLHIIYFKDNTKFPKEVIISLGVENFKTVEQFTKKITKKLQNILSVFLDITFNHLTKQFIINMDSKIQSIQFGTIESLSNVFIDIMKFDPDRTYNTQTLTSNYVTLPLVEFGLKSGKITKLKSSNNRVPTDEFRITTDIFSHETSDKTLIQKVSSSVCDIHTDMVVHGNIKADSIDIKTIQYEEKNVIKSETKLNVTDDLDVKQNIKVGGGVSCLTLSSNMIQSTGLSKLIDVDVTGKMNVKGICSVNSLQANTIVLSDPGYFRCMGNSNKQVFQIDSNGNLKCFGHFHSKLLSMNDTQIQMNQLININRNAQFQTDKICFTGPVQLNQIYSGHDITRIQSDKIQLNNVHILENTMRIQNVKGNNGTLNTLQVGTTHSNTLKVEHATILRKLQVLGESQFETISTRNGRFCILDTEIKNSLNFSSRRDDKWFKINLDSGILSVSNLNCHININNKDVMHMNDEGVSIDTLKAQKTTLHHIHGNIIVHETFEVVHKNESVLTIQPTKFELKLNSDIYKPMTFYDSDLMFQVNSTTMCGIFGKTGHVSARTLHIEKEIKTETVHGSTVHCNMLNIGKTVISDKNMFIHTPLMVAGKVSLQNLSSEVLTSGKIVSEHGVFKQICVEHSLKIGHVVISNNDIIATKLESTNIKSKYSTSQSISAVHIDVNKLTVKEKGVFKKIEITEHMCSQSIECAEDISTKTLSGNLISTTTLNMNDTLFKSSKPKQLTVQGDLIQFNSPLQCSMEVKCKSIQSGLLSCQTVKTDYLDVANINLKHWTFSNVNDNMHIKHPNETSKLYISQSVVMKNAELVNLTTNELKIKHKIVSPGILNANDIQVKSIQIEQDFHCVGNMNCSGIVNINNWSFSEKNHKLYIQSTDKHSELHILQNVVAKQMRTTYSKIDDLMVQQNMKCSGIINIDKWSFSRENNKLYIQNPDENSELHILQDTILNKVASKRLEVDNLVVQEQINCIGHLNVSNIRFDKYNINSSLNKLHIGSHLCLEHDSLRIQKDIHIQDVNLNCSFDNTSLFQVSQNGVRIQSHTIMNTLEIDKCNSNDVYIRDKLFVQNKVQINENCQFYAKVVVDNDFQVGAFSIQRGGQVHSSTDLTIKGLTQLQRCLSQELDVNGDFSCHGKVFCAGTVKMNRLDVHQNFISNEKIMFQSPLHAESINAKKTSIQYLYADTLELQNTLHVHDFQINSDGTLTHGGDAHFKDKMTIDNSLAVTGSANIKKAHIEHLVSNSVNAKSLKLHKIEVTGDITNDEGIVLHNSSLHLKNTDEKVNHSSIVCDGDIITKTKIIAPTLEVKTINYMYETVSQNSGNMEVTGHLQTHNSITALSNFELPGQNRIKGEFKIDYHKLDKVHCPTLQLKRDDFVLTKNKVRIALVQTMNDQLVINPKTSYTKGVHIDSKLNVNDVLHVDSKKVTIKKKIDIDDFITLKDMSQSSRDPVIAENGSIMRWKDGLYYKQQNTWRQIQLGESNKEIPF